MAHFSSVSLAIIYRYSFMLSANCRKKHSRTYPHPCLHQMALMPSTLTVSLVFTLLVSQPL